MFATLSLLPIVDVALGGALYLLDDGVVGCPAAGRAATLDGLVLDVGRRRGAGGRRRAVRRVVLLRGLACLRRRRVASGAAPCHRVVTLTSPRATSRGLASAARLLDALVALARLHQATSWMRWVRRPALGDGVVGSVLSIACVEILLAGAAHDHRLVA